MSFTKMVFLFWNFLILLCLCFCGCLLLLHVRSSFPRPSGLSSHGSRTEENSRAEADTIRSLFQGISFSFLLSISYFFTVLLFCFFAVLMSMFFVFVWGEDDSVCLVSSARSFFWSCALSLNVSCLLEVLAIVVGFFFITELEAEVIIFSSLLNTIVLVSLYCQRFGSFRRPCKIATILNLLQSPRQAEQGGGFVILDHHFLKHL
jgi:hypothetical protein